MNVNDIFPSRFVKAHDLGEKEVTVTIKSATMEDMGHGAEKETKLCIWFERATKGFVLNKTNAMIIASMYGPETDNWKGKAITIYSARVKAFGAWHDAVRVKEQIPARNVGAARIPDAMQEAPPLDDEEDLLDVDEGHNENVQPGPSVDVNGDVLFAQAKPKHERLSVDQAAMIEKLGKLAYPDDWDANMDKLAEFASGGARSKLGNLWDIEAEKLIKALNKKVAQMPVAEEAQVPA